MSRLLSIAAGVCPDVGPLDFVPAVAEAGWEACGIWFDADTWTDSVASGVRQRLDDTGLIALDMEPIFVLPDGDGGSTDHGDRVIDAAATVGARNILVVARGVEAGPFADRLAQLCDRAASHGINCAIEFMGFMSTTSLTAAAEIVSSVDRRNAAILVDNLHLARTGGSPADLLGLNPDWFPYAQLCDAPAELDGELIVEALDGRVPVGEGGLPVAEVVRALPANTPLSMEVRSKALRDGFPDPADRARALLEPTVRFMREYDA